MTPSALCCVLVAGLAACDHTAPFMAGDPRTREPLHPGFPLRLTYSAGVEEQPAWLPDGQSVVFSFDRLDRPDRDRCLGVLPAGGGQLTTVACDRAPGSGDSTNGFAAAAVAADGGLAYVRASAALGVGFQIPTSQAVVLGSVAAPTRVRVLQEIPFTSPSGLRESGAEFLRWRDGAHLVFLGQQVSYAPGCCGSDAIRTGIELLELAVGDSTATVSAIAGTASWSSYARAGGDTTYFTMNGDSRVYRRASDSATVVVDFDTAGIARDVQVAGSRVLAVVGGKISFTADLIAGPEQRDRAGVLHIVTLPAGTDSVVFGPDASDQHWFRRPAVSPDGTRFVVEGYPVRFVYHVVEGVLLGIDTLLAPTPDLWVYDLH